MGKMVKFGPTLPTDEIESLAHDLNDIYRSMALDLSFRLGKVVIERLYGDVETWAREGTRRASYRQLAKRGDLLMNPSTLCRAVGMYALSLRLGGHSKFRHLGTSHFQELLPLDTAEQERLARVAEADRWTVDRLRDEVSRRRSVVRRTAKDPQRLSMRFAHLVGKQVACLAQLQRMTLDAQTTARLHEALHLLKAQVEQLEAKLADDVEPKSGRSLSSIVDLVEGNRRRQK